MNYGHGFENRKASEKFPNFTSSLFPLSPLLSRWGPAAILNIYQTKENVLEESFGETSKKILLFPIKFCVFKFEKKTQYSFFGEVVEMK